MRKCSVFPSITPFFFADIIEQQREACVKYQTQANQYFNSPKRKRNARKHGKRR